VIAQLTQRSLQTAINWLLKKLISIKLAAARPAVAVNFDALTQAFKQQARTQ